MASACVVRPSAGLRRTDSRDPLALIGLLDPEATATADGGGTVDAARRPGTGSEPIARACLAITERAPGLTLEERTVNGQPGLLLRRADGVGVLAFDIVDDRIRHIWAVHNPTSSGPG